LVKREMDTVKVKRTMADEILEPVHESYKRFQRNVPEYKPRQIIERGLGNKYQPSNDFHEIFSSLIGKPNGTVRVEDALNVLDAKPERAPKEAGTAGGAAGDLGGGGNLPQPSVVESKPVGEATTMPLRPSIFERFSRAADVKDEASEDEAKPEKKPEEKKSDKHDKTHGKHVSVFEKLSHK